jgi:hypothetical protein
MTGAQVIAQACKDEGVAVTHAADAFIRVSGEFAVASGTEGPDERHPPIAGSTEGV